MTKSIVQYGQSLFDLAIQYYGSEEGIFALLADNPGLVQNWHDDPKPGTEIYIKTAPLSERVAQYYRANSILPASLYTPVPDDTLGLQAENEAELWTESGIIIETETPEQLVDEFGNFIITEDDNILIL